MESEKPQLQLLFPSQSSRLKTKGVDQIPGCAASLNQMHRRTVEEYSNMFQEFPYPKILFDGLPVRSHHTIVLLDGL